MRIAMLKPPIGGILGLEMLTFVEPLGFICIAGGLEERGHVCKVVDLRIDGPDYGMEQTIAFAPDIIGVQCNFTTERFRTVELARRVRKELPGVFVVVGGHDASREPEWFEREEFDAIAIGDGEEVMLPLVEALERGVDPAEVNGLHLRRGESWLTTGPAPARRNLDELPMPARHLISQYAPHYYINFRKPLALMETARGCPFKCNFCSVWKFHESTFREKSAARVVAEIEEIEADSIFITDDIFWLDRIRGEELAVAIKEAGIRKHFTVQTRTDIICKFPHLVEMWKDCGDLTIFLGLESVTNAGLAAVNKSNTADNNVQAIEILKDLNVGFTPNFIVDPAWDREDFADLARLDLGAGDLQQRILRAHAAARHRPVGRGQEQRHDPRLGDVRHHPHGAADQAAARGVLRGVLLALAPRPRRALPDARQGAHLLPDGRRARHRPGQPGRPAQGDEHRQGVLQARDVPPGAPRAQRRHRAFELFR